MYNKNMETMYKIMKNKYTKVRAHDDGDTMHKQAILGSDQTRQSLSSGRWHWIEIDRKFLEFH